jgi:hypothetical protein
MRITLEPGAKSFRKICETPELSVAIFAGFALEVAR